MGFYEVAVVVQQDATQKHTYHTKYHTTLKQNSTQSYTNNKKHITHNEYNNVVMLVASFSKRLSRTHKFFHPTRHTS
jgi:hypothetical protein